MKRALAPLVTVIAICGFASPAAAGPVPGPNGPIVFTSGRDDGLSLFGDANAQEWLIGPTGGSAQRLTTGFDDSQHRHPAWSPDRKMIVYARCAVAACGSTGPFDIILHNLELGSRVNITAALANSADRPNISPDGTTVTYGRDGDNGAPIDFNIYTQPVNGGAGGAETPVAATANNEEDPNFSADSQRIYYQREIGALNHDIYRVPTTGGAATPVIADAGEDDIQPSVSPDGQNLCFSRGSFGTNDSEVKRSTIGGAGIADVSVDDNVGSYNCVWSPDGTKIAYADGLFPAAALVSRSSNGTGGVTTITNVTTPTLRFDGNPDWAPNPAPTCNGVSKDIGVNGFALVPLDCPDNPDPPNYFTSSAQSLDIVSGPQHGVLGEINDDKVIYTPNTNFQGTDAFTFKGDDGNSDSNVATVTIKVGNTSGGGGGGDKSAPSATLSGSTSQNIIRQKAVIVTAVVNEAAALTGGGSLSVPGASKSFKLKGASANATAGAKVRLKLKLSSKALKAARRAKKKGKVVRAAVTVTAKDAAGNAASFKRSIKSKAKKR